MGIITTDAYDIANAQDQKEPIIVLEIEGAPFIMASSTVYTKILYDDPGVYYDGTYVYDGLRPVDPATQRAYIDRKGSSSTISQKLEQWDGKASVETFNIKLIDVNREITSLCSPGQVLEDILNRKVKVYFGYKTISYPDDYIKIFQGYINNIKIAQGSVFFTFTDPSSKRKQTLFNATTIKTTAALDNSQTTISLTSTESIYRTITNAKGVADTGVTIGLVLDNKEIITYTNAGIISGTQISCLRGQYGTTAVAHDAGVEVKMFIALDDNPLNIALKTQLSGWNGPWKENLPIRGIVNLDNGNLQANTITFDQGVDLERDYGLTAGDFITISGSPVPSNNNTYTLVAVVNNGRTALVEETNLIQENPPLTGFLDGVVALRSKYDVYPITAGLGLDPEDVFVSQYEYNRQTFIKFNFKMEVIGEEKSAKTWIEQHLFKPIGAYSLTQGSQISMGLTHAPLAVDLLKFLTPDNVINASQITVERGLNTRFFYNEVAFNYAYDPIENKFNRSLRIIDADAQNRMNQVSVLEIDVRGLPDEPDSVTILSQRAERILQRHRFSSEIVNLEANFAVGHTTDSGDVIILQDYEDPVLNIANTETGTRGITNRVMEVQERTIDISGGKSKFRLLSNNGFSASDRYGVIGPSSQFDATFANSTSQARIVPSFGALFGAAEWKKWDSFQGYFIKVHNLDYSQVAICSFTLDDVDPNIMKFSPSLPFTPDGTFYVEFEDYDDSSASRNDLIKTTFVSLDSAGMIFSGSSSNVFTLQSGYSSRYTAGMICYVISPDGSRYSDDVKIVSVVGDIVTVGGIYPVSGAQDLGFTPQNGDILQLAGFKDSTAGYRYV